MSEHDIFFPGKIFMLEFHNAARHNIGGCCKRMEEEKNEVRPISISFETKHCIRVFSKLSLIVLGEPLNLKELCEPV